MKARTALLIIAVFVSGLSVFSCSVVSTFQRSHQDGNELALQNRLLTFRAGIRKYASDKKDLPQTLADLRNAGYGTNFTDPVTEHDDWQTVVGEDPTILKGKRGIIDVRSNSTAISSRGTPYNTW
jgi:hypothetical protein